MTASEFYTTILTPAAQFAASINPALDTPPARLQMLATAGYESRWEYRAQFGGGPALGFWMDQTNAVQLLLDHPAAGPLLRRGAEALGIAPDAAAVHAASENTDAIAYLIARLLAWCDPHPVPAIGDEEACWHAYLRAQNPGALSRKRWAEVYPQAVAAMDVNPVQSGEEYSKSIPKHSVDGTQPEPAASGE